MVTAKFEVNKVSEFGYGGSRSEIHAIKKHVPANTADPDDGSVTRHDRTSYESTGHPIREISLTAVYGGSPEDNSFSTATPTGSIVFQLNNPNLNDEFKPGDKYYVEFHKIPKEAV